MKKLILTTPFITIFETSTQFEIEIPCRDGSVIAHEPFPNTIQGRVNALQLAVEVCAGKFLLNRVLTVPQKDNLIERKEKINVIK